MPGLVYVVDDDASFRTAIERRLKLAGYEVETYSLADSCWIAYRVLKGRDASCYVRIRGLSGPELQSRLVELGFDLADHLHHRSCRYSDDCASFKAGAEDFLTKPDRRNN